MFILFLVISTSVKGAFVFVPKNIWSISYIHANRLSAANIERPLISHDNNDIIELVGKKVTKTRHYFGDKSMHVDMYNGVDVNIIVRVYQILISHNKVIGADSPNQYLGIGEKSKEEMWKTFKLCVEGKKGVVDS